VLEQRFANFARQVQAGILRAAPLSRSTTQHRKLAEAAELAHQFVERRLAAVAEGRVADVVAQGQRLAEGLVERQRVADAARHLRDLQGVRQARAVVVALGIDEDLGLVHQAPETGAVHDPIAVALPAGAQVVVLLVEAAAARAGAVQRVGRQIALLAGLLGAAVEQRVLRTHGDSSVVIGPVARQLPATFRGLDASAVRTSGTRFVCSHAP
jgi:ribosomal protein L35AE/L33A